MVLMACCDAHYRFTLLSIGSAGRESDGGIFQSTVFGQCIIRDRLPLPDDKVFNNFHAPLSAVFVGKEALANRSKYFIFPVADNNNKRIACAFQFFLISGDAAFPL